MRIVKTITRTETTSGTITAAEIKEKFSLPVTSELIVTVSPGTPAGEYDVTELHFTFTQTFEEKSDA